jgi:hypothetical protein
VRRFPRTLEEWIDVVRRANAARSPNQLSADLISSSHSLLFALPEEPLAADLDAAAGFGSRGFDSPLDLDSPLDFDSELDLDSPLDFDSAAGFDSPAGFESLLAPPDSAAPPEPASDAPAGGAVWDFFPSFP